MPSKISPDTDKVKIQIIKDCLLIISERLTDIINLLLSSNIFSTIWKTAEVVPLEMGTVKLRAIIDRFPY